MEAFGDKVITAGISAITGGIAGGIGSLIAPWWNLAHRTKTTEVSAEKGHHRKVAHHARRGHPEKRR
jgi:hypothetical protein